LLTQIFFLIVFLHGLICIFRDPKDAYGREPILFVFALPACFLILTLLGFHFFYFERHAFMLLPYFYLILARGITGIKTKPVRLLCLFILLACNLMAYNSFIKKTNAGECTVHHPNPEWRLAVQYFDKEWQSTNGSYLIFVTAPATVLMYYDSRFHDEIRQE